MSHILLGILLMAASAAVASPETKGVISVKVVDQHNDPVPAAIVRMYPPPGRAFVHVIPECKTDASGTCSRTNLPMGTYFIRAMKPSDGYLV